MEVKIFGKKNNCEHTLRSVDGNIKWCTKCGMIEWDRYDENFVMLRREHHYPELEENKEN